MRKLQKHAAILLIGGIFMFCLFGCAKNAYSVDYKGQKDAFAGAKDAYRAGTEVTVYYGKIATDTDYFFYLDGQRLNPEYVEGKGFALRFTMPEHNVSLSVESRNSTVQPIDPAQTDPYEEIQTEAPVPGNLTFSSFDGGGPEYNVSIADAAVLACHSAVEYGDRNHEELDGAPYVYIFDFIGLKPGKTKVTITGYSPITGEFEDIEYIAAVNDALEVTLARVVNEPED